MHGQTTCEKLDDSLLASLPDFSHAEIEQALECNYGITGKLSRISGERDLNLKVRVADGRAYVFKISGDSDAPDEIEFQNAALASLEAKDPTLPVPRVVAARDGRTVVSLRKGGREFLLRLLTYLDGEPLFSHSVSSDQRLQIGVLAARLDLALADFAHPGAERVFIWDVAHAGSLGDKIRFLDTVERRSLVERTLARFAERAQPLLPRLRRQVVHNDLNQHNVLLSPGDGSISGIIDFGDMVNTVLVAEIAIAAAHLLYGQPDVLGAMEDVVRGYASRLPLQAEEIEVLPALVQARLASRELIVAWRRSANPDAAASYRDDVSRYGWEALARCDALSPEETLDRLAGAAGLVGRQFD